MSSTPSKRSKLIENLDWELRNLSTSNVLSATTISQRVGMGANDWKCAELLVRKGPMTAGQLAKLSGLTTGAITGVVDRLERAGWARREHDPKDRRRVIIHPGPQDTQTDTGLYDSYMQAMNELVSNYDDRELRVILDFVRRLVEINKQIAEDSFK